MHGQWISHAIEAIMTVSSLDLELLLPLAVAWAEEQAAVIAQIGYPLDQELAALATGVGVTAPGRIRIVELDLIALPEDACLRQAAAATGLLGPATIGLTLGHGIYIRRGHANRRVLSHEFRHVHQYEMSGSVEAFLREYLSQLVAHGYLGAPYEIDARRHEV